jgi:hypothetical protein
MTLSPFSRCGCGTHKHIPAKSTSRALNDECSGGEGPLTAHAHLVHTRHRVAAVAALETTATMMAVLEHTAELRPSAPTRLSRLSRCRGAFLRRLRDQQSTHACPCGAAHCQLGCTQRTVLHQR